MRLVRSFVLLVAAAAVPTAASAQEGGLASLLLRFFSESNPVVLRENPEPFNHAAHFVSQPEARGALQALNANIALQLSTFPIPASAAGFAYTFDPATGVYDRATESFGPTFGERPITAGKGRFELGVTTQRATWDRIQGSDLQAGDLQLYLRHQDVTGDGTDLDLWFEGDVIRADVAIDLTSRTTVVFANYGVGDHFDLSVAVPFVSVDLSATIDTHIERLATQPDPFVVHAFPGELDEKTFTESGSASGIGDMVVRAKWNFLRSGSVDLALTGDLRLPTGKEDDLLGSGATQFKPQLVVGGIGRRFAPRASVGYTFSSGGGQFTGDLPNELNYTAGFDAVLHPRVTLTADFLGRRLFDTERVVVRDQTLSFVQRTDPTVRTTTRATLTTETGNLNLLLGSAGLKVNPVGNLLIVANLLFSIGEDGLQDKVTPVFGIDYSF